MFFVIVGLGNPGGKYRHSRHNIGFWVIDILAARHGIVLEPRYPGSLSGRGLVKDKPVCLLQPQTFMNLSGEALDPLLSEKGVNLEHLAVVHDDLDLEIGRIQVRTGGSDGGHRGIRSIIQHLDSKDFIRLRLGISKPSKEELEQGDMDTKDYVLSKFTADEAASAKSLANKAADAVELWLEQGLVAAMNSFNRWKSPSSTQEAV